jgi:MFS family permease
LTTSMLNWQKFFKINATELPKVISFMILAAVFQAGLTIGTTAGDSLFLSNIGVESLPYIYIIMPLIMALYASVFSYFISKLGIKKLLYASVFIVSTISLILFFAISMRDSLSEFQITALYYAIKIFTTVVYIAFYSLYWNYADLYFDMSESKRLFAYLAGGTAIGVIIGGLTVSLSTELLGVSYLFLLWMLLGLSSVPVIYFINSRYHVLSITSIDDEEDESAWMVLKKHWSSIIKIRYVSLLAGMVFLVSLLAGITEYQYYDVFSKTYTEEELAILLGWLYAGVNVFNLIVCAFLFNRLVLRIGVTNVAMIQPVVYILTFSFLLLDYGFSAAILAFFAYQGMAWSVDNNNYNLMYNALPNANRAQLRTILEGLLEPIATAIAGVYLIFYASKVPAEGISLVGFLGALILFAIVMFMKKNYLISLVQNLKTEWLDFSRKLRSHLSTFTDKERDTLFGKISASLSEAISALKIMLVIHDSQSLPALLRIYDLTGGTIQNDNDLDELKISFESFLEGKNYHQAHTLVQWFNNNDSKVHPHIAEVFAYYGLIQPSKIKLYAESSDPDLQNIALIASIHSADLQQVAVTLRSVQDLLDGESINIQRGLRVLRFSKNSVYAITALPYIHHKDAEVRLAAFKTIKATVAESTISFVNPMIQAIRENEGATREICIDILERINDPICVKPLLLLAPELTPSERRLSEDFITGMGNLIIPTVVSVLSNKDASSISRSLAAKVLYRVAPIQFELIYPDLIKEEIGVAEALKHNESVLASDTRDLSEINVLRRYYRDTRTSKINLILEFLSTVGRLPAYELMINSLGSTNPKIRAFGIETLEQGVDRTLYERLIEQLNFSTVFESSIERHATTKEIESVVTNAVQSTHPIEKSAALSLIWRSDKSSWIKLIRSIIQQPLHDLVKETTVARLHNEHDREQRDFFERLVLLCETQALNSLHIDHLEYMAHHSTFGHWKASENIASTTDPAETLFIHFDGIFECKSETENLIVNTKGTLFPVEVIQSKPFYLTTIRVQTGTALMIPYQTLELCAKLYPEVAIHLFELSNP